MAKIYGVWLKGRRTAAVVTAETRSQAISKVRKKKVVGASNPVVAAKVLTGQDLKDVRAGKWIRTRADGTRVSGRAPESSPPKYRPGLGRRRK